MKWYCAYTCLPMLSSDRENSEEVLVKYFDKKFGNEEYFFALACFSFIDAKFVFLPFHYSQISTYPDSERLEVVKWTPRATFYND